MLAYIRAIVATLLVLEISGAFALGLATLLLLQLHITGVAFWSVEAVIAAGVFYVCALFFLRAIRYEKSPEATAA